MGRGGRRESRARRKLTPSSFGKGGGEKKNWWKRRPFFTGKGGKRDFVKWFQLWGKQTRLNQSGGRVWDKKKKTLVIARKGKA